MVIANKIIFFMILISLVFDEIACNKNSFLIQKSGSIENNLPSRNDLDFYLDSLERIINYAYEHKHELDLNFMFGLFLINVNLHQFTRDELLPVAIKNNLKNLLTTNSKSLYFFTEKKINPTDNVHYNISRFFKDSRPWSRRLKRLGLRLNNGKPFQFGRGGQDNPKWRTYVKNVDNIDKSVPSPKQSDYCIASLAINDNNNSSHTPLCSFPEDCKKMLRDGTNFGYGVTHRLLFLLLARLGRGCAIFSPLQDAAMVQSLCETIHTESKYLAYNGYRRADLMFEQIALCTLDGHAEFLRRAWLSHLLRYQTLAGCFRQVEADSTHDQNGTCNGHMTAAAAGTLAAAARFLLENY